MFSKRCEAHRKHDTLNCLGSWVSLELSEGRRRLESARRGMHRDEAAAPRCRETRQGPVRSGRPADRAGSQRPAVSGRQLVSDERAGMGHECDCDPACHSNVSEVRPGSF